MTATEIKIEEKEKAEAGAIARSFANESIRSRAYINTLGAETVIKYLEEQGIQTAGRNIHSIRKVLEEIDIADIILDNIHIDVRVVFDENEIFIPKSHFENKIIPDIYIVLQLDKTQEKAEFLGFFEPRLINTKNENEDYYFIEKEKLSSIKNLKTYIENSTDRHTVSLSEDEREDLESAIISMIDNNISNQDKQYLIEKLVSNFELRDRFIEFENFEMLSYQSANLIPAVGVERPVDTVETVVEDNPDSGDDLDFAFSGIGIAATEAELAGADTAEALTDEASDNLNLTEDTIDNFDEIDLDDIFGNGIESETSEDILEEQFTESYTDDFLDFEQEEVDAEETTTPQDFEPEEVDAEETTTSQDFEPEEMNFEESCITDEESEINEIAIPETETQDIGKSLLESLEIEDLSVLGIETEESESIEEKSEPLKEEYIPEAAESFREEISKAAYEEEAAHKEETTYVEETAYEPDTELYNDISLWENTEENNSSENFESVRSEEKLAILFDDKQSDETISADISEIHQEFPDGFSELDEEGVYAPKRTNIPKKPVIIAAALLTLAAASMNIFKAKKDGALPPTGGLVPAGEFNPAEENINPMEIQSPPSNEPIDISGNTPNIPAANPVKPTQVGNETKQAPAQKPLHQAYPTVQKISWEAPDYLSYSESFKTYLRSAGKSIKLSLSSDLLLATEYPYSNVIKIDLKINSGGHVNDAVIIKSSGSTQIDQIVLQTVKDTLNVVKPPSNEVKDGSFNLGITISL